MSSARHIKFTQGGDATALSLRLTPDVIDALRQAQSSGTGATVRFGQGKDEKVLTVGDLKLNFKTLSDDDDNARYVLSAPSSSSSQPANIIAHVTQKLQLIPTATKTALAAKRPRPETTTTAAAAPTQPAKRACIQLDNILPPPQPIIHHQQQASTSGAQSAASTLHQQVDLAARSGRLSLALTAILSSPDRRFSNLTRIREELERVEEVYPSCRVPEDRAALEALVKKVAMLKSPGYYNPLPAAKQALDTYLTTTLAAANGGNGSLPNSSSPSTGPVSASVNGLQLSNHKQQQQPPPPSSSSRLKQQQQQQQRSSRLQSVEPWVEALVSRSTNPNTSIHPPITSEEEYRQNIEKLTVQKEWEFRLSQHLESNTRLFHDLQEELERAGNDPIEQKRLKGCASSLWLQRGYKLEKWDKAYTVVKKEIGALTVRLHQYQQRLHSAGGLDSDTSGQLLVEHI